MRRNIALLIREEEELVQVPREALDTDITGSSGVLVKWIDKKTWDFLLYARSYVIAYPDDICNKLVYRNLLKAYANNS
jgi:hypothetical protein